MFKLKEPFAPFLGSFEVSSAPMIPRHLYEGTDFKANPANQTPIGTGPFKLTEWKKGAYIHLVRNDAYWKPGLAVPRRDLFPGDSGLGLAGGCRSKAAKWTSPASAT